MLVHQHGRGGQGFLHHRRDGARGELLASHNAKDSERWRDRPMRRNMTSVAWATFIGELEKSPFIQSYKSTRNCGSLVRRCSLSVPRGRTTPMRFAGVEYY